LKKDEGIISKLILIDLYSSASKTLAKLEDKSKCPVCDRVFDGDLVKHIADKHKVLETLENKKTKYITEKDALVKTLEQILRKVEIIKSETNEKILLSFNSFFSDIEFLASEIPNSLLELKKLFKDLEKLNLSTSN